MTRKLTRELVNRDTPVTINSDDALQRMQSKTLDVLVVGGGITGVSAALDARSRGLTVGLVERDDFASGTSSASSKMIHGGLRYVQQKHFRLVYHSLLERQRMYKRAPHLVSRLPFLFPIYREHGVFSPAMARAFRAGLAGYDVLGGWRIGRRHRRISAQDVMNHCPTLRTDGLEGGLLYYDCRTDDARLTVAVGRTAAALGAHVANGVDLVGLTPTATGHRAAVRATKPNGTTIDATIDARVIVNAAGVWSDAVTGLSDADHPHRIRPAKGVHVVVPWGKVRTQSTLVFPMLGGARGAGGTGFAVRWGDHCYIGTTDTPFDGDLDDVRCTREEAEVLIESLRGAVDTDVSVEDITGTWAGLRPLIDTGAEETAELSREHEVTSKHGIVTVAGGKLTVARTMAEIAIDKACEVLGTRRRCRTAGLPIIGGAGFDAEAAEATGGRMGHLSGRYGTEARFVEDLVQSNATLGEPLVPGLPYLKAEAVFAVRHEGANSVEDVLTRRIPARFLDSSGAASAAQSVAEILQRELSIPAHLAQGQTERFIADTRTEKELLEIPIGHTFVEAKSH